MSYHTSGDYSAELNYFTTAHTNGSADGACQRHERGRWRVCLWHGPIFPTNTYNASNYWVDVVFDGAPLQPPVSQQRQRLLASRIPPFDSASALLANDTDPYGLPLSITGVSNPSNGTVTYNPSTQTVNFTPDPGYTGTAGFTYTITDGLGDTASANVALTVTSPPPVANNDSGFVATENTALSIPASALLANDTDPNGLADVDRRGEQSEQRHGQLTTPTHRPSLSCLLAVTLGPPALLIRSPMPSAALAQAPSRWRSTTPRRRRACLIQRCTSHCNSKRSQFSGARR